jgi:hypothetical protein
MRREGNGYVVDEGMRRIDGLRFRLVGLNHTRLSAAGADIPLDGIRNGSLLLLDMESTPWFRWGMWRMFRSGWPPPKRNQEELGEISG